MAQNKKIYTFWCNHRKNDKICGQHKRPPVKAYANRTVSEGVQVQHVCVKDLLLTRIINRVVKKCEYCGGATPCIVLDNDNDNDNNNLQDIINYNDEIDDGDDDIKIDDRDESTISLEDDDNNNNSNNQQNKMIIIQTGNNEIKNDDNDEYDNNNDKEYSFKGKYLSSSLEKNYHQLLENWYTQFGVDDYYDCRELHNLCSSYTHNYFMKKITDLLVKDMATKNNNNK